MPAACFLICRLCILSAGVLLWTLCSASAVHASITTQVQRIAVRPKAQFTRITINLTAEPNYAVHALPDGRLRVRLHGTTGTLFKQFRRYSDPHIGGIVVSRLGDDLVLTFAVAVGKVGWRVVHLEGLPTLTLDVGPLFIGNSKPLPGRERIRAGAEKLLKNFDPPLKPEIPFMPTDRQSLKELLSDEEQKLFLAAEGALYKGKLAAAEETFAAFSSGNTRIRPLALYRLGETQYRLQKYQQALATFREAAGVWPAFLGQNPSVTFYFGDSIARNGDLPGGRQLLTRLIVDHADKKYAPVLLVRMADILSRQGSGELARAIYTTVSGAFPANKARQMAMLKLADERFLDVGPVDYADLSSMYQELAATAGDFDLREETTFKHALLESINGPADGALSLIAAYQKRYPKGVYSTVVRDIREDLVAQVFQGGGWDKDPAGLIKLATDNQEFLGVSSKLPGFYERISNAYAKAGRPLDQIVLYAGLLERPWLGDDNAAYLTLQVAGQAEILGDTLMARRVLQSFLQRYPTHAQSRWARERLAAIQYGAREFADVRINLQWILEKNERAAYPVSYYYLGKALWESKDFARVVRAMELYLVSVAGEKKQPPLVVDAYYVGASARQSLGDRKGAISLLDQGVKQVPADRTEQFLYKLGELTVQDGRPEQARQYFEKIIKEGKDPDWQRLARLSLAEINLASPPPVK
jgi:TolA-binding protein